MIVPDVTASADEIQRHLNVLCADIGNRIAASENESRAAAYVAERLRTLGLANVTREEFPFHEWGYEVSRVEADLGEGWRELDSIPVANSQSTPAEGIEAELVCVDNATPADLARQDVRGKLLLVWGPHGETTEKLEQLNECGAAGVLWVDDRMPFDYPVSIGTPYDWRDILQLPQVCVPYTAGWGLARSSGVRVRMRTEVWSRPAPSVNVFGDLPGTGDEMVHIGGHLDCVIVGVGADDDASGVAVTLEVARLLSELDEPPLRRVRFVAYGAEEQLSEGSRRYVLAHREEVDRTRLCIQLDSVGSIAGRNQVRVVGPEELMDAVRGLEGYSCEVMAEVSPYSDMFPYNIFGAPSAWFYRVNMPQMRHFHHSAHDDLDVVSAEQIALTATATAQLAWQAAFEEPGWARGIPEDQAATVAKHAKVFFGL